jgi:hypothetical protein
MGSNTKMFQLMLSAGGVTTAAAPTSEAPVPAPVPAYVSASHVPMTDSKKNIGITKDWKAPAEDRWYGWWW